MLVEEMMKQEKLSMEYAGGVPLVSMAEEQAYAGTNEQDGASKEKPIILRSGGGGEEEEEEEEGVAMDLIRPTLKKH